MEKKRVLKNLKATLDFGKELALNTKKKEIIAISGPLGSGKTSVAQGIAKGFGINSKINSPTFNIIKVYPVKKHKQIEEFVHIDAYRLKSDKELLFLGINEYFQADNNFIFIEWAEKIKDILPKNTKKIKINYFNNNKERVIYF